MVRPGSLTAEARWPGDALLVIAGPTAAGKSDMALALARRFGGEILNIDSVQMYRELDIGSAKPSKDDQRMVPHHLIDLLEPGQQGTVAEFLRRAEQALQEVRSRGKLPVMVGGTGLYLTALLQGLAPLPKADPKLREELERDDTAALYERLGTLDPGALGQIHGNDRVRIIRALESFLLSGQRTSEVRSSHGHKESANAAICVIPMLQREALYERINLRSERMVQQGLLAEVRTIVERWGPEAPALEAIGYRECVDVLSGKLLEDELAGRIAFNTRRFAKRQLTFWRNEPCKRGWRVRPAEGDPQVHITGVSLSRSAQVKPMPALAWDLNVLEAELRVRLLQPLENSEVWFVAQDAKLAS